VDDFLARLVTTDSTSPMDVVPRLPSRFEPMRLGPALGGAADGVGSTALALSEEDGWAALRPPAVAAEPAEAPATWPVTPTGFGAPPDSRPARHGKARQHGSSPLSGEGAPRPVPDDEPAPTDAAAQDQAWGQGIRVKRDQTAMVEPDASGRKIQPNAGVASQSPRASMRPSLREEASHLPAESESLPHGTLSSEQAGSPQGPTTTQRPRLPKTSQDEARGMSPPREKTAGRASSSPWEGRLDARLAALAIVPRESSMVDIGSGAAAPAAPPPSPTIHVTIGRVEVRAAAPAAPAPRKTPAQPSAMSLEEYLRQRADGGRR
jgi:hypothetical protein